MSDSAVPPVPPVFRSIYTVCYHTHPQSSVSRKSLPVFRKKAKKKQFSGTLYYHYKGESRESQEPGGNCSKNGKKFFCKRSLAKKQLFRLRQETGFPSGKAAFVVYTLNSPEWALDLGELFH